MIALGMIAPVVGVAPMTGYADLPRWALAR